MIITLAIVVLCASILAFFAQEFARMIKKIFSIPGFKLLVPLILVSFLIEVYEAFGLSFLLWCQSFLHRFIEAFSLILPFGMASMVLIRVIFLFLIASISILAVRQRPRLKRDYSLKPFSYWLGLALWIIAVILFSVP